MSGISKEDWNDWRHAGITRAFGVLLESKKHGYLVELLGAVRVGDEGKAKEWVGRMDAIDEVLRDLRGGNNG
jgi:hypothetical protein